MIPRALDPTGIIFADKPAGPSSFKIVAEVRRQTGARTGHAGTLDPFATGLLVLLLGPRDATRRPGSSVWTSATSLRSICGRGRRQATPRAT